MFILRFLGVVAVLIIVFSISLLSQIDMRDMMNVIGFVLITDTLIYRWLSRKYLMAILDTVQKEKDDNEL